MICEAKKHKNYLTQRRDGARRVYRGGAASLREYH